MDKATHVIAYDIGTTGCKTCLYRFADRLEHVESSQAQYPLHMTADGGAEQSGDDWWEAICSTTKAILAKTGIDPSRIAGMAFCCQMQGSIHVDREGKALRPPMIYMDARATKQSDKGLRHGLFRINGWNAFKVLKSLRVTGGMAATAKDPLWKYHWVRENEPEVFNRTYKWLDVKDYLVMRCTGEVGMTPDSANVTFVYDTRPGRLGWSDSMCRTFGIDRAHLPEIVESNQVVGRITSSSASEMGLREDTPVFGGGGDVSMIAIGAGCLKPYDTHIYVGTSGWVVSNVDRRMADIRNFMASILGAIPGRYNYIAEQETSGLCLQWVRDHLALDEIGYYLQNHSMETDDNESDMLYDLLNEAVMQTEQGAGGLIFTPWLHGNRAPREDPYSRGMFFNIGLDTGKRVMVRAVLEGVALHKRWILKYMGRKIPRPKTLRFVGGGAKSDIWCQIMADVTGCDIETIERPQDAGAVGAAIACCVGLGKLTSFEEAKAFIPAVKTYRPREQYKETYDRLFEAFEALYEKNKGIFRRLNKS